MIANLHVEHFRQAAPTRGDAHAPVLKDPVCAMPVTAKSFHQSAHMGRSFYFCGPKCKAKFNAHPLQYVEARAAALPAAPARLPAAPGSIYTCPMHPEIRQDHTGNCPKCGMALEPVMPTLDDGENPELQDFQRRFWWTLPLTGVVFVLAMAGHRLRWMELTTQSWVEFALATPVMLWAGWPFFVRGAQSVVKRSPNIWTFISLGTGAAYLYSVVATVAPGAFPESFMAMGRVAVYFEAAAVIISLTLLGQLLELKARSQTSASFKSFSVLAPKTAGKVKADGSEEDTELSHVHLVDLLRVRPGEKVPVDGS